VKFGCCTSCREADLKMQLPDASLLRDDQKNPGGTRGSSNDVGAGRQLAGRLIEKIGRGSLRRDEPKVVVISKKVEGTRKMGTNTELGLTEIKPRYILEEQRMGVQSTRCRSKV